MSTISGEANYVQTGSVILFEDFSNDGPMWTGAGERERSKKVQFSRPFFEKPIVQLSIVLMDARTEVMLRYRLMTRELTNTGFEIVFQTWSDSKFARCHIQWTAFGRAVQDEFWADF